MKKNAIYAGLLAVIMVACVPEVKDTTSLTVVPMPSTLASGNTFPIDSTMLNGWIDSSVIVNNLETNKDIITHGWDIWDALSAKTNQTLQGDTLRVFETWYTPTDIQTAIIAQAKDENFKLSDVKRQNQGVLQKPHQHLHESINTGGVAAFVKYDPTAANHIFDHKLYDFNVLKKMIKKGKISNIPKFPASSVAIKPAFFPLTSMDSVGDGLYKLPVWPGYSGQIPLDSVYANGFGPGSWDNDIKISTKGESDPENNIFPIDDFIHFKLDSLQATQIVNLVDTATAKAGDHAVLIAMHVNSRENRRWTWQTFWWSKTPDTPNSPSSELIGSLRPSSLDRAARHYGMAVAYNMVSPTQPYTGGTNAQPTNQSIYAYNPYLEAPFPTSVFDVSPSTASPSARQNSGGNDTIQKYYPKGYQRVGSTFKDGTYIGGKMNRVGIESNCMSCHGQARIYDVANKEDAFQYYVTDQYIDLDAPYFKSTIVLDFVWSIQGNLIEVTED